MGENHETAKKTEDLIRQFVCFNLEELFLGVDIGAVQEIIHLVPITKIPRSPSFVEGVVNLRGRIIPIVDLSLRFGLESSVRDKSTRIIVIALEEMTIGFIVNHVSEVIRLKSSEISQTPEIAVANFDERFIDGVATIKKDDRLLIVVDFNQVFSRNELEELKQ